MPLIRTFTYLVTLLCWLISSSAVFADSFSWKLEKESDGIRVYTAKVGGSDFRAFHATMTVQGSLTQLVAMHTDPDDISEWLTDCKKSELMKKVQENEYYIYYVSDAPWPVQDRDYVLHSKITQDPNSKVVMINFEAVTDFLEKSDECVRMAKVEGFWQFKPTSDGNIDIMYQVHADPNGDLPAWLANAAVVDQPFETMKTIRKHMNREKYLNAKLSFIVD